MAVWLAGRHLGAPVTAIGQSVKIVLIDFHTHSSASDGALSPWELVSRAVERGVGLLAITDHDTVEGHRGASAHPCVTGGDLRLVPGVELSCRWSGVTIHVVGLGIDCDHPAMLTALATLDTARTERAAKIAERLAARGFEGALAGARAQAGDSQLGRPHFAAWMVDQGHVEDHNEAFDRFLGQGKMGDVKTFWPPLAEAVGWIGASGGVPVLAHPCKYRFTGMKLRRLLVDFVAAGGRAMEIQSGRQTPEQSLHLRRLAAEFDLEVSVGSDFHRDAPYSPAVGVEPPRLDSLQGVWRRWTA